MSTPDRRDPLARPAPTRISAYRGMPLIERLWQRLRAAISGERGLTALVLGVILLVGVLMRVWALGGTSFALGSDDSRYVAVAQNLASGHLPSGDAEWFGARGVFLWPVAAIFRAVGANDYSAIAWPFVISLVSIVVAFLIARELAGRRPALVAAGLVAVAPIEVLMATRLRPDAVMPAFVALAVWAALRARRSPHITRWLVASGVLLGAGWACRETALLMLPVVVLAAWPVIRPGWQRVAAVIGGLVAVPLVEMAVFAFDGRPLWPITITAQASSLRSPVAGLGEASTFAELLVRQMFDPHSLVMLALPVVLIALAIGIVRRTRAMVIPAAWLAWSYAVLEVGSIISVDAPARFLTQLTIPAALVVAIALDGRLSPLIVAALAIVTVLAIAPRNDASARDANVRRVSAVTDALRPLPRGPVLSDNYVWWAKLNAFLPMGRLPVDRAVDPAFLNPAERRAARRLNPLPDISSYRGGYVVTGPATPTSGWPTNWAAFRDRVTDEVPWGLLVPVARIGDTAVWRWPE